MQPVILIPARMRATRLPGKPLADIAGKPMIVRVWQRARMSGVEYLQKIFVACDDERIARAVESAGGQAVMTRSDHSSGSDRIHEALQHIDPGKKFDVIINLQGDMPLIEPDLIYQVCELLRDPDVDIGTLAVEIHEPAERDDPAVVKAILSLSSPRKARALYFTRVTAPSGEGPLYHHIGIYAYRREALEKFVVLPPSTLEKREKLEQLRALEAGMHIAVGIADHLLARPLSVDTPEQLAAADSFWKKHFGNT